MAIYNRWIFTIFMVLTAYLANAQRIVYSEPDRDDSRRMNFEIIGKLNGNFLIYKSSRNKAWISVLNNDMKEVAKAEQNYLPDVDKVINVDFFPYSDFVYMIYQYRKKNIIYAAAAKIDGMGQQMGDLIELDTTMVNFGSDNRIYTAITSEDKSKIMLFKINSKNKKRYLITSMLMDQNLSLIKKSRLSLEMQDKNDMLNEFHVDNDGDMIFCKFERLNNEAIDNAQFIIKYAQADSFDIHPLKAEKLFFDEIKIKPDNYNKRYFLTSFYYLQKRGNTEGYYFYIWDKKTNSVVREDTLVFSDELRREARGNSSMKTAFNDYFVRNIITRRDGGFIIASEAYYTSSRGGSGWNRWNYLYGSPYMMRPMDYYYYSPYYGGMYGNRWFDQNNVRHQADNVIILSFDAEGKKEWSSVIAKEQWDDQSSDLISYNIMTTGGEVHFLFNTFESRRQILTDYSLQPDGKINRNPTLKNLERNYEFMPKYGKQVSSRQMIIPCLYRNYICFAKLEFN